MSTLQFFSIMADNVALSIKSISYSTASVEVFTSLSAPYIIGVEFYSPDHQDDTKEVKKTITSNSQTENSYMFSLQELECNTIYSSRAFVYSYSEDQTFYSESLDFSTKKVNLSPDPYVDLGLSVKWASCNLDATKPFECGGYYAYGETEPKDVFTEYLYADSNLGDIYGNPYFDAATKKLGERWRLPKYEEVQELADNCSFYEIFLNGRKGMLVEGITGNCIFLPYAGVINNSNSHNDDNTIGVYWAGNQGFLREYNSYWNHWDISYNGILSQFNIYNGSGASIRPVYIDSENTLVSQCAKPSISLENGYLKFTCETEGAEFVYSISSPDFKSDIFSSTGEVKLEAFYNLSVYAVAEGLSKSEVANATIYWIPSDGKFSNSVSPLAIQTQNILIQSANGCIRISGLSEGTNVYFYSIEGVLLGNIKSTNGTLEYYVEDNSLVIAKFGTQSLKIAVR